MAERGGGSCGPLILVRVGIALVAVGRVLGLRRLRLLDRRQGLLAPAPAGLELRLELPDLLDLPFLLRFAHGLVLLRLGRLGERPVRLAGRFRRRGLLVRLKLGKRLDNYVVQLAEGVLGELVDIQLQLAVGTLLQGRG